MFNSVALDVTIGLIFIFLLYSLLATVLCEIAAQYLGLRARNLKVAIRRMLEDSPETSEKKIVAFFKHLTDNIFTFFNPKEGPALCVFYHIPVIKYLSRNTFYSKPSYITRQNFSKALIEIFRRYGGDEDKTDLEKIRSVLTTAIEYPGVLKEIKEAINKVTQKKLEGPSEPVDYTSLRKIINDKANSDLSNESLDIAQSKLLKKIKKILELPTNDKMDKAIVYKIDEILNLFGHETRYHLLSLLKDANNDLVKFKLLLEQWFDDTMDRATGWYKQKIQFLLLIIGLCLAVIFNASTVKIVQKLSKDKASRELMVKLASGYAGNPDNLPTGFKGSDSSVYNNGPLWNARMDSLDKVRQQIQKDIDDANSILGVGWNIPDSLILYDIAKYDSIRKGNTNDNTLIIITLDSFVVSPSNKIIASNDKKVVVVHQDLKKDILDYMQDLDEDGKYAGYNKTKSMINVKDGFWSNTSLAISNFFSSMFWGYLLTAIAISMGAPFWFDLLNKLVQIRGSVKEPARESGAASPNTSDPSSTLNRKG